jgi:hypothetical protein
VLDQDPRNPTALTYFGWALLLSGEPALRDTGREFLMKSVEAAPEYPDAYAFLAILENRLGNFEQADKWLDTFDALDPSPDMASLTDGLRAEIDKGLAGGGTTTTTTASTTTTTPTAGG